jgi:alpha-beta hydrolase superfamily lysophospholipase
MSNVSATGLREVDLTRFPIGYHQLHPDIGFNFQLNRFWNWVGEQQMLDELAAVGPRLLTYDDWRRELLELSDRALDQGRRLPAAYYARLADFYMHHGPQPDPRSDGAVRRFREIVLAEHGIPDSAHHWVPYQGARLSAYRLTPADPVGSIVVFGGFDSYIEEWLPFLLAYREAGLDVVAFDGPGQGAVIAEGTPFTGDWHLPVGALLDYFNLDDVTLHGFSLGGGLVIRAAAYEPRVTNVISMDICTEFDKLLGKADPRGLAVLQDNLDTLPAELVNAAADQARKLNPVADWLIGFGMRVTGTTAPRQLFDAFKAFRTPDVSPRVTQNVLLLAGAEDHLVPLQTLGDQQCTLRSAKSVTARIFTHTEQAQNHCQIGNLGLAFTIIADWLNSTTPHR